MMTSIISYRMYGLLADISTGQLVVFVIGLILIYASLRCFYNLHFHPASKFPGPRLAAVSNVWYAYHWVTGKYPMAVARALEKYGDVVRVAPNEVVFITPEAASAIYGSHTQHMEHFPKTNFIDLGNGDLGIAWERDPVKHRKIAKKVSWAFSAKSIKAKEPTIHKYIDLFVQRLKEFGSKEDGIDLRKWTDWLAMDLAADLAYSHEMNELQNMENAPFLDSTLGVNFFVTIHQVLKKFPLLVPLQFLFVPPSALISQVRSRKLNNAAIDRRIESRETKHPDHFDAMLPTSAPTPTKEEEKHFGVVSAQLIFAGYEPIASQFQGVIMFSLLEPQSYQRLVKEIRDAFENYEDITAEALVPLKFLHACLMETLRLTAVSASGRPRVSPGATIDGTYIAKGVTVQYGHFAFTRNPRYFHEPHSYRPQRWLPEDDTQWESAFKNDARDDFHPFGQGPRACPGKSLAWRKTRLFVAKVLWSFDIEMLPNQNIVFERDFNMFALWERPQFWIRLNAI